MTTKNLELYFQHAPLADIAALAATSTVGMVNGLIVEVAAAGLFEFQTPAVATPDGRDVVTGNGGGVWIRQTLPALTTTAGGAITISKGGTSAVTQQAAINSLAGAVTNTYYLRGNGTNVVMNTIQAGDVPTLNQSTSGTAAKATNIVGGTANDLPYQTAADTTGFISAAASSVLVTDGSNVPSLSTTLPAVEAGACTCTDPTTSSSDSIDNALSNVYSAITPPLTYTAHVSAFSLDPTSAVGQTITGAQIVLPAGKYLISYSLSSTFSPVVANVGFTHELFSYIIATPTVSMANTLFLSLKGQVLTGSEVFGGTASASVVYTFSVPTTLDVTALFINAAAGSALTADEVTITAVRLANTVSTYTAHTTVPIALDSTSTSPQIVTGAQLALPIGTYLLSYSAYASLVTQVADALTPFAATAVIYNTTAAADIANTVFTCFSGYAETGSERFGGTAAASVVATFAAPTTLDVYVTLSDASDAADTYVAGSTITAVKLA